MKISEKQLEALAGFLGVKYVPIVEGQKHTDQDCDLCESEAFPNWLLLNNGQEALRGMLSVGGWIITSIPSGRSRDSHGCLLRGPLGTLKNGEGRTRQEALINAVLDMLGVAE